MIVYRNMAYIIPIVQRTIRVVQAIAANHGGTSMHQLARDLQIAPSSCFRIIRTLEAEGWIAQKRTGGWELSLGLARLLDRLSPVRQLLDVAPEPLVELGKRVRLACKLSMRQGDRAVTLLRVDSPAGIGVSGRVGAHFPLTIGSSGAILVSDMSDEQLAELISRTPDSWTTQTPDGFLARAKRARKSRIVTDEGSFSPHVHTASIAVHDAQGEVMAALTILGMPGDITRKTLPAIQAALVTAAEQIEYRLRPGGSHA